MTEPQNKKVSYSKHEEWLSHMNACKQSHLNHAKYCRSAGISYSSFKYWRGVLLNANRINHDEKFVKIEKPVLPISETSPRSIRNIS